jgi:hypothetical protein
MSEEINQDTSTNQDPPTQQQTTPPDPIVEFLSRVTFNTNLFDEIRNATFDPEKYHGYLKAPDLFVLMNMIGIIQEYDPNGKIPEGQKDHLAFINLIKWMLMKFATDPVWISYIGWFGRMYGCHQHPSSYWPIKYSDCFAPDKFFKRGQPVNIEEENKKMRDPNDVFAWKENW